MKTAHDMVVMGDINLDWSTTQPLSFSFADLTVSEGVVKEGFEWRPIEELPGGSGLNFAQFAKEKIGYEPLLLGKIGDDPAGRFIYDWLEKQGLEAGVSKEILLESDKALGTGKAFIVRDEVGIRLLVNTQENANQALTASDVERHSDVIKSCRILYISGYCLMKPEAPRTEATFRAMKLARNGGQAQIVFDVVPHRFYKIYKSSQFRDLLSKVDILVSGVPTIRRLLEMGIPSEKITRPIVKETAERLAKLCDGFSLRFGPSGCDEQVIWDAQSQKLDCRPTGHDEAEEKRGYGDILTLRMLKDVFKITPNTPVSSD